MTLSFAHAYTDPRTLPLDPLVLFVVPSKRRARTVIGVLAGMSPSLAVIVWSSASSIPPLMAVQNADARRQHARTVAAREGL